MKRIVLSVLLALIYPAAAQATITAVVGVQGLGNLHEGGTAAAGPIKLELGNSKAVVNHGYVELKASVGDTNWGAFAQGSWYDEFKLSTSENVNALYLTIDFEYRYGFDFDQPIAPEVGSGLIPDVYGELGANGRMYAWGGGNFEHGASSFKATSETGQTFNSSSGEISPGVHLYRLSGIVSTNQWLYYEFRAHCMAYNTLVYAPASCTSRYRVARAYVSDTYFPLGQNPIPTVHGYTLETRSGFDLLSGYAVPEPSTWILMIVGFGAVGCSARRRPSVQSQTLRCLTSPKSPENH